MWQTFRCNHCVGHRRFAHIKKKKRTQKQVTDAVRDLLLTKYRPEPERDEFGPWGQYQRVSKEDLARQLAVDTALVEHALHLLNREGLVSRPSHSVPHDCNRARTWMDHGSDSSWICDTYIVCGKFWKKVVEEIQK